MNTSKLIILALTASFAAAAAAPADDAKLPAASDKAGITYATDIKPIFDNSCVKCHSGDHAKARLHLDSLEGAMKGTKHGKVIIPGDPEKSQLVQAVGHLSKDDQDWMPPLHNKAGIKPLTQEQISLIMGWIKQGAK
ncbi:MAG TPA: c-type cytochrome domain-containing protein [Candidatus Binatia bacterium]|nr:c-type cytochrome domain-containing protein [Candidatus Binatia bacterium]